MTTSTYRNAASVLFLWLCMAAVRANLAYAGPNDDPFAAPGSASATDAGSAGEKPTEPAAAECEVPVSQAICNRANTTLLVIGSCYVILAAGLWTAVRKIWDKRGTSTAGARFGLSLLLGGATGGVLVAIDPLRTTTVKCCLADPVLRSAIVLADSTFGRAAMAAAATIFLFVLINVLLARLTRS